MVITSSPFGGQSRTAVLVALGLLEDSYPRELARIVGRPLSGVQMALRALERDGLVAGRLVGRTRVVRLNPRYFARDELRRYLLKLADADPVLRARVEQLRRRPRRSGKPL
jgi:DNA-binding transcriptional ArsR family regulator